MSATPVSTPPSSTPTATVSQPVPSRSSSRSACTPDLSSSVGSNASRRSSIKSTKSSGSRGQTPPYWSRQRRSLSNVSYVSISASSRRPPILLEDHTEEHHESNQGLWAQGVTIDGYHVVSAGTIGAGSYVVWHCKVKTLQIGSPVTSILEIPKRYSEFDLLRDRLVQTFPDLESAIPPLPPKSVVSRFRAAFLEKRREGLEFFLNCVLLNPDFASSPVLKAFIFA